MPEDITNKNLSLMSTKCARSFPNQTFAITSYDNLFEKWNEGIQRVYLDPAGIPRYTPFSYNQDTIKDIKKRNPHLENVSFISLKQKSHGVDGKKKVKKKEKIEMAFCNLKISHIFLFLSYKYLSFSSSISNNWFHINRTS